MTFEDSQNLILVHVAGPDGPGITGKIAEVVRDEGAELIDIGQSVLHGYAMVSAILRLRGGSECPARLTKAAGDLGLRIEVTKLDSETRRKRVAPLSLCITLLGSLADGSAMARLGAFLADRQMNIREIRSLIDDELKGLELIVDLEDTPADLNDYLPALRGELLGLGMSLSTDLAVQKEDIFRRNKRLVCMDVDSTFVRGEFIDELAGLCGCKEEVQRVTERAMRGELDFRSALTERVALLKGLPLAEVLDLGNRIELMPGASTFVETLKSLGFRVGLVSGGFTFFVDELKRRYGFDFAFANELEVSQGKLTGKLLGPIVDAERKAQVLRDMAHAYNLRLEQTVAIGDGANDILMLQTAGLGIAFRAKPKLQSVAHMSLNHHERLDTLLYLMGFSARELRGIAKS